MSYTILIVDDSAMIRDSIRSCIEQNTDWRVCGESENGEVAVERVKELHPDSVVRTCRCRLMNGLETAKQINTFAPDTAMVMFTSDDSEQLWNVAQATGVRDVVSKCDRVSENLLASLENARPERTQ